MRDFPSRLVCRFPSPSKSSMETKYLIFDCSTEIDSLVAIVAWTPKLAESVLARFALACEMHKADKDFLGIQFMAWNVELYEGSIGGVDPELEDLRWGILTEKPDMSSKEKVRMSSCFLDVDNSAFYWIMHPKHSSCRPETEPLAKDTEGLFP